MKLIAVHKINTLLATLLTSLLVFSSFALASNTITQQELDIGNTLIKQKKFIRAIVYYGNLEVKYPTSAIIKNNLAVLKAHSGNVDNAISLLKQALNSNKISNVNYANLISLFEYQTSIAYREVLASKQPSLSKPALSIIYKLPAPIKPKIIIKEVIKIVKSEPEIIYEEIIKEIPAEPKIIYRDVIKEVPAEPKIIIKEVIKIVESEPKIVYKEIIKEIPAEPKIVYRDVIKEIPAEPKIIYKEVIKEVIKTVKSEPKIIYKEVIKEVPAEPITVYRDVIKEIPVEPKMVITDVQTLNASEKDKSRRLINAMQDWKNAWANQSSFKYINSYVSGYKSSKFNTHNAWKAHRINRITKPDFIKIEISKIKVIDYSDTYAKIKFIQHYQSDNFKDKSNKILVFKLINNQWKITSEISL